jgi:hypothetical protein
MNDTPTPRTDALMPDQGHKRTTYDHIQVMETHARQLERELAEVTKQRDALAFSIRFALANSLANGESETKLRQALAATEGGKP